MDIYDPRIVGIKGNDYNRVLDLSHTLNSTTQKIKSCSTSVRFTSQ